MRGPPREWSDGGSPELQSLIHKHCVPFMGRAKSIGLTVAVVRDTNAVLMAFGRPALSSLRVTHSDTLFEIGSLTKTFTGTTLAREIEQGLVRWDQPIQEIMPAGVKLPDGAQGVTLRHLTTHTSGFPRLPANMSPLIGLRMLLWGGDPYAGFTEKELLEAARSVRLEAKPGAKSSYSNFGVTLLGYLLALKAGADYEALVKREICGPLSMNDTTITLDGAHAARTAQGYRAVLGCGPIVFALRSSPWFDAPNLGGAGALRSTGADLLKYLKANMRPEGQPIEHALRESHREFFREDAHSAIGMNWVRSQAGKLKQTIIWHNGATGGFHSYLGFTEDGQTGVLILSNTSEDVDPLARKLLVEVAGSSATKQSSSLPEN